jgi:hypothetical protein
MASFLAKRGTDKYPDDKEHAQVWKRATKELSSMDAQLHDADLFPMLEDGRWQAKSEAERHDYAKEHWGVE